MRPVVERILAGLPPEVQRVYAKTGQLAREAAPRSRIAAALGELECELDGVDGAAGMMIAIALEMYAGGLANDARTAWIVTDALNLSRAKNS